MNTAQPDNRPIGAPCHRCGLPNPYQGAWCPKCRPAEVARVKALTKQPYGKNCPPSPRQPIEDTPLYIPWLTEDDV